MTTFSDLGIPFPLFEAAVTEACEYIGAGICTTCGTASGHTFRLGIGCALMLTCPRCTTVSGLDLTMESTLPCRRCGANLRSPVTRADDVCVCYKCLREGRAAITKDTPFGMVSWEESYSGVTGGVPGLRTAEFETVQLDDDWVGARIPLEAIYELLRTPTFPTIQSPVWEFCCRQPMIYQGAWQREEFSRRAPNGDGKAFFLAVVRDPVPGLWEDELHDETGVYVFRCGKCGVFRANWDIA